jgi:hypothetical protein
MNAKFYYTTLNSKELRDFIFIGEFQSVRELYPKEGHKELYFFEDEMEAAYYAPDEGEEWVVGVMLCKEAMEHVGYTRMLNDGTNVYYSKEAYTELEDKAHEIENAGGWIEEGSELYIDDLDFHEVFKVKSVIPFNNTFCHSEPLKILSRDILRYY